MSLPLSDIGKVYKQILDFKNKIVVILQQLKGQNILDHDGQPIHFDKEIKEVEKYYDMLIMAKKANARMPIELLYNKGIAVYAAEILLRDKEFFLGQVETIVQDPNLHSTYEINQKDLLFIKQIRMIWDHLEAHSSECAQIQKNIWDYVQIICLLSEKALNKNVLATTKAQLKSQGLLK